MKHIITAAFALFLAGCFSSGDGSNEPDAALPPCPPMNEAGVEIDPDPNWCGTCVDGRGEVWHAPCDVW